MLATLLIFPNLVNTQNINMLEMIFIKKSPPFFNGGPNPSMLYSLKANLLRQDLK